MFFGVTVSWQHIITIQHVGRDLTFIYRWFVHWFGEVRRDLESLPVHATHVDFCRLISLVPKTEFVTSALSWRRPGLSDVCVWWPLFIARVRCSSLDVVDFVLQSQHLSWWSLFTSCVPVVCCGYFKQWSRNNHVTSSWRPSLRRSEHKHAPTYS